MIESIPDLIAGAAIFAVGGLFGRRFRGSRSAKQPRLKCSCGDGYGTHDEKTGVCHGEVRRPIEWGRDPITQQVEPIDYEYVPCPCKKYDGPVPIESYVGRTIALPPADQ